MNFTKVMNSEDKFHQLYLVAWKAKINSKKMVYFLVSIRKKEFLKKIGHFQFVLC